MLIGHLMLIRSYNLTQEHPKVQRFIEGSILHIWDFKLRSKLLSTHFYWNIQKPRYHLQVTLSELQSQPLLRSILSHPYLVRKWTSITSLVPEQATKPSQTTYSPCTQMAHFREWSMVMILSHILPLLQRGSIMQVMRSGIMMTMIVSRMLYVRIKLGNLRVKIALITSISIAGAFITIISASISLVSAQLSLPLNS